MLSRFLKTEGNIRIQVLMDSRSASWGRYRYLSGTLPISRLIGTDPLGAHLDYFGFADNTGIGGLTGRSTEVNSG